MKNISVYYVSQSAKRQRLVFTFSGHVRLLPQPACQSVQITQVWRWWSVCSSSFLSPPLRPVAVCVEMPGMCSVPGCKGYKKARSRGVVFHSLPTRDPERCRKWLKAIQSPKFDENTPVSKYGNIRVCSQHFKAEDYEPDIQAELMKTTPRKILKAHAVPTVFSRGQQEHRSTPAADDRTQLKAPSAAPQSSIEDDNMLQWTSLVTSGPSTSSQASSLGRQGTGMVTGLSSPSLPIPLSQIASGTPSTPPQSPPPAGLSVASVDRLNESFHQETESRSTAQSDLDENTEEDLSRSRTIVNDSCLMELFEKCQTCGQTITKKKVSHCGAQKKVRWSCLGGHRGIWMSSPHLLETFPEIHLLTALSILFSGGTFTHFKKWAKHLHLNFMGHKTFFEIQKAYLNPEMRPMNRPGQEGIFEQLDHQHPEGSHNSDPLKKIKAKSRRRQKGVLSSRSRGKLSQQDDAERQSEASHMASEVDGLQDSFVEMDVTIDEDECSSVKNRLSEVNSDMENDIETAELRAADDSGDEDVYVPIIAQRSTTSEMLLECEEEELEPWQKPTSHVHLKEEDDVGELSNDHTDCKPERSLLQRNVASSSQPLQPAVINNQVIMLLEIFNGVTAASHQLTSNTELSGSLEAQHHAQNSLTALSAVKTEAYGLEVHQISNSPYVS
ncbi:hypothetical protein L3Q82_009019, partial [Scortum barcoo]